MGFQGYRDRQIYVYALGLWSFRVFILSVGSDSDGRPRFHLSWIGFTPCTSSFLGGQWPYRVRILLLLLLLLLLVIHGSSVVANESKPWFAFRPPYVKNSHKKNQSLLRLLDLLCRTGVSLTRFCRVPDP